MFNKIEIGVSSEETKEEEQWWDPRDSELHERNTREGWRRRGKGRDTGGDRWKSEKKTGKTNWGKWSIKKW